ncbi:MAG: aminotransferase class I/II-fold pyridoxal phosphate-dependent enzyme [Candidatus Altiarchaeota archaeon]|nr:aminotransferase class I/II-fold pyridoxal phosphate-dependent enzyme [Candidatus Altiarchaeota archaeon]
MQERDWIFSKINQQNNWRKSCINLIASENVNSKWVENAYASDFSHRYAEGVPYERYYQGTRYIDEIEDKANKFFAKRFGGKYADTRPISGAVANMAAMRAFAAPGDVIASLSVPAGAHSSHQRGGVAGGILGLNPIKLGFDSKDFRIDPDLSSKIIRHTRPKLAIIGASLIPFPLELDGIVDACRDVNCKLIYDSAHVFGLIFAGKFQDPFKEGAEIITSSTHKTFPGPQGGIIIGNLEDEWREIQRSVFPRILSNHHLHRIPALLVAGYEMAEFGEEYSTQILKNAVALAEKLNELGFDVAGEARGFTKSHQVVVDVNEHGGGWNVAKALDKANIVLNKNLLPWDKISKATLVNPSGIRLGVQEMTRFGMKEDEMEEIANFISRIVIKGDSPDVVGQDVKTFRQGFQKIHYTWDD